MISDKVKKEVVECRRDIHKHAETGWTEFRTSSKALKKMKKLGYTITMGGKAVKKSSMMGVPSENVLAEHQRRAIEQGADPEIVKQMTGGLTGFWADMVFSSDGPKLAFRFDMDANDMNESSGDTHRPAKEGFASVNPGAMHACGHDGHTSLGLAIAEVVAGMKDSLKGSIRFIFQPAEEGLRGAKPMMDAGAVDGVNYIMGMHVGFFDKGSVVCGANGFLASTKTNISFTGAGAHAGAYPQLGKNALLAACNAALNIHAISRHGSGASFINVGKVIAGEGRNVVAPSAYMEIETRGASIEIKDYLDEQVARIVKGSAEMYNCTYGTEITGGANNAFSSEEMIDIVAEAAGDMPYYNDIRRTMIMSGGEDFTYFLNRVQENGGIGSFVLFGADVAGPFHNGEFDFDEEELHAAIELGVRVTTKILK